MGTWQGANTAGGGLTVNGQSTNVIWTVVPPTVPPNYVSVPDIGCVKHRLGPLALVGDDVEGTCVGCGAKVVVPALPHISKVLLRALDFEDRMMAILSLPEEEDRRRAALNALPDFAELCSLVESSHSDLAGADRVIRVLRAQFAPLVSLEDRL